MCIVRESVKNCIISEESRQGVTFDDWLSDVKLQVRHCHNLGYCYPMMKMREWLMVKMKKVLLIAE